MLLSDDHLAVQDAVRAYVRDRIAPQAARWDKEHHFPRAELAGLAAQAGELVAGLSDQPLGRSAAIAVAARDEAAAAFGIFGAGAGDDLLHEAVAAMYDHGNIDRIGKSIHVHPTLSELVKNAARAAR